MTHDERTKEHAKRLAKLEFKQAQSNYQRGVYNLDKAIGHIAGVMNLGYKLSEDSAVISLGGEIIKTLREQERQRNEVAASQE